jgi:S-adenosylmethionine:tRNA ribosyltransferase-isomerase
MTFEADGGFESYLERFGRAPLPPYIKRKKSADPDQACDRERYQTVYAKTDGSIAAPTAGLHFSGSILDALCDAGVETVSVTLHVGIGTFMPIETQTVEDHVMEAERYEIGEEAATKINRARRVIAVGTTATRALESAADDRGAIRPQEGETKLFIYPGYKFKRVDALITNFHLPRSSLFLLVSAFAGADLVRRAYARALASRYLFYSYGDCMLIL